MLRIILVLLLGFSAFTVNATDTLASTNTLSSVQLLKQQCEEQQNVNIEQLTALPILKAINQLDNYLLKVSYINNQIRVLKNSYLNRGSKESLLICKIWLANSINRILNSSNYTQLITQLQNNPKYQIIAKNLRHLQNQNLSPKNKSMLFTANATFLENLHNQDLQLSITRTQCQLNTNNKNHATSLDITIASYLLSQHNTACRKDIWLAYQHRAINKNMSPLKQIWQVKHQQAMEQKFNNYADFYAAKTALHTPDNVRLFLQHQLKNNIPSPWNIGRELSLLKKDKFTEISSQHIINNLITKLVKLDIHIEKPAQNVIRFWLGERLLGDIYLLNHPTQTEQKFSIYPITESVIGKQFGSVYLQFPKKITTYSETQKLINIFAQAITLITSGNDLYLTNYFDNNKQIGLYWLKKYLTDNINKSDRLSPRQLLIQDYQHQIQIINALLILNFYEQNQMKVDGYTIKNKKNDKWINNWKISDWSITNIKDITQSQSAIISSLWHKSIGDYIYQKTHLCNNQQTIFNSLFINEKRLTEQEIINKLLSQTLSTTDLIQLISNKNKSDSDNTKAQMTQCPTYE